MTSMNIEVLYEDNHLIAIKKPAGILIQAGDRRSANLLDEVRDFIKQRDKKPGNVFLGLVHRLDKPVSGIIVFAKTSKGASRLSEQFRNRKVRKIYTALVEGNMSESGALIHFLKKDEKDLIAKISDSEKKDYQTAELAYEVIKPGSKFSLLRIHLKTGRFNQIRAQLAHIGHPIAGDNLYGAKTKLLDGSIGLSATEIEFETATTGENISLQIDFPNEWNTFL